MHFLNFVSLLVYVSPPCASLPCRASFTAASEFGWARVVLAVRHRPHEDVMGLEWCMGMPPLCTSLTLFLFSFMSPHHALISLVVLPSPQRVSSVGQGLCWLCGTDRMRTLWVWSGAGCACTGRMRTVWVWSGAWECPPPPPPPPRSLPKHYFSPRLCPPPCASLPCHASFAAAGEFGWARVVLAARAPAA